jgi:hypothetical protein
MILPRPEEPANEKPEAQATAHPEPPAAQKIKPPLARRILSRAWATLCYISLAICCASGIFWARSLLSGEGVVLSRGGLGYSLSSTDGLLVFVQQHLVFETPQAEQRWREVLDPRNDYWTRWHFYTRSDANVTPPMEDNYLGFQMDTMRRPAGQRLGIRGVEWRGMVLQAPHWSILLLAGVVPGIRLYRLHRLRQSRAALGLCRKCGFDLGGVYHSCPICGHRVPVNA